MRFPLASSLQDFERPTRFRCAAWVVPLLLLPAAAGLLLAQQSRLAQEEAEDYYRKWLNEDVVYIISPEERDTFQQLTTPEEKEQFIEQFWYRRDPDPRTAENEHKEEHYRRIAFANETFASGIKGWQTDRGKIYIIHGPPDEIQSRPSGGPYHRPLDEGGGRTVAFPFEIWRYRFLEGIGSDVVMEFVDRTQSGEYRLSLDPEIDKDVLLHVDGYGLTLAEEMGFGKKQDRLYFSPGNRFMFRGPFNYYKDPFERYERFAALRQPAAIRYPDLRQLVEVNISFNSLPFRLREDYLKLNDAQVLVPLTLEVENRALNFREEEGVNVSKVAIYGIVTSITNRIVEEFDDDLLASYKPSEMSEGRKMRSLYQKILTLDRRLRYKMTLVVKDTVSGNVGTVSHSLIPPAFDGEGLKASSLILSDRMEQLEEIPREDQMFVLGDFYVRPSMDRKFRPNQPVHAYFQIYNAAFDQTTLEPSLSIIYRVFREGETVLEFPDVVGRSVQYFSGQRIVVAAGFPMDKLEAGSYLLDVQVTDNLSQKKLAMQEPFEVIAPTQVQATGLP